MLTVALAHHEVERAKDRGDVRDHVTGEEFRDESEVAEGGAADLETVRHAAAFGMDVETELAFGVFVAEIDFAFGGGNALRSDDEVVDQLFHAHQDFLLVG